MNKLKKNIYNYIIPLVGQMLVDNKSIPVLYYHNVVQDGYGYSFMHTEISVFREQMNYLKEKGYKTYTFSEIPKGFKKESNSREVIITFDDGFLSNYTIVFPLLWEFGLKYNIFLTAGYLENKNDNYLDWKMVKEMSESKIVGFGAHTYTHIDSRKINKNNYHKEIEITNELIKKHTQKEVNDFCFPYGYYNDKIVERLCANKTYKRLYTCDKLKLRNINKCEIVGRLAISNDYNIKAFKKHLQGYYDVMHYYILYKNFIQKLPVTGRRSKSGSN